MTARTLPWAMILALSAVAQSQDPRVVVNLDGFRYPSVAALNRIAGDVTFEASGNEHKLVSSANVLLTIAAEQNLRKWTLPPSSTERFTVTYSFELPRLLSFGVREEPVGSRFSRFWRRLVGEPTTKRVPACTDDLSRAVGAERTPSTDSHVILISVREHYPCHFGEIDDSF